jgi:biotin transport system substrate-specific component
MSIIAMPQQRRVLADVVPQSLLAEVVLVTGAAALVGLLAQISFHLSFTPVPITGQTLGVMLAGAALGWRRAGMAMSLYLVAGIAGVPWFENHTHGYVGANFGYLIGFVVAGTVLGWLSSMGTDRTVTRALVSMVIGDVIIFVIGVTWLKFNIHVSPAEAITLGFNPFLWGELIKAAIAGIALPSSWYLVDRMTKRNG